MRPICLAILLPFRIASAQEESIEHEELEEEIVSHDESDSSEVITAEEWPARQSDFTPTLPDTQVSGYLSLQLAQDTVQETDVREDVMELRLQAFARVDHHLSERLRLHLDGWLDYWMTGERGEDAVLLLNGERYKGEFEATLGEAYLDFDSKWFDLRGGTLITIWGLNDFINPNDVVNPRDLRRVDIEPETTHLSVLALRLSAPLGLIRAEAIWVPFFRSDRIDLFGTDWAFFGGPGSPEDLRDFGDQIDALVHDSIQDRAQPVLLQTELPAEKLSNSSAGARFSTRTGGYDVAAQVFYGFERQPDIEIHPDLLLALQTGDLAQIGAVVFARGPGAYRGFYRRALSTGVSFGTSFGDLGVRLDVAYSPRRAYALSPYSPFVVVDADIARVAVDSDVLEYTAGLEYLLTGDFTVQLEVYHEALLDLPADQELLLGGPNRYGAALLLRYTLLREDLELRFFAVAEASEGSIVASPQVIYRITDYFSVNGGAQIFEGAEQSVGGLFDRNDQAYVGAKARF